MGKLCCCTHKCLLGMTPVLKNRQKAPGRSQRERSKYAFLWLAAGHHILAPVDFSTFSLPHHAYAEPASRFQLEAVIEVRYAIDASQMFMEWKAVPIAHHCSFLMPSRACPP